jgi:hypothetical protein
MRGLETMPMDSEMKECLENCMNCYESCSEAVARAVELGGRHAAAAQITLLMDCAEICLIHANYLRRASPRQSRLAAVCVDVCGQCAAECRTMAVDNIFKQCAAVCERCMNSCERMAL